MSTPKPKFFISRGNGVYTALIPADELPEIISLQGVPCTMTVDQVVGMTLVAEASPSHKKYELEPQISLSKPAYTKSANLPQTPPPSVKQFYAPDAHVGSAESHKDLVMVRPEVTSRVEDSHNVPEPTPYASPSAAVRVDSVDLVQRPPPPSGKEPDESKKIYCSYWLHYGSCDYTQQGCKYKHEMPDEKYLKKLGFRQVPKWYLEQQPVKTRRTSERLNERVSTRATARTITSARSSLALSTTLCRSIDRTSSITNKDKAPVLEDSEPSTPTREQSKVKRSFTNNPPTVFAKLGTHVNNIAPTLLATLPPPVCKSPIDDTATTKKVSSKSISVPTRTFETPISPNEKHSTTKNEDLIDFDEDEGEQSPNHPRHSISKPNLLSSPQSLSASPVPSTSTIQSDSDSASTSAIDCASSPSTPYSTPGKKKEKGKVRGKERGIFVPYGESPLSARKRYSTQQSSYKNTNNYVPKVIAARERKTNGLDASVHAVARGGVKSTSSVKAVEKNAI